MNPITVATEEEIARRLTSAIDHDGATDAEIVERAQLDMGAYYRYKRGEVPTSAIRLVRLGLSVGLYPDALFLHEFTPQRPPTLNEIDFADLRACVDALGELSEGFGEDSRPCAMLRAALEGMIVRRRHEDNSLSIPRNTVITEPAPGERSYVPPPPSTRRRLNNDSGKIEKASEQPPVYGKRKQKG